MNDETAWGHDGPPTDVERNYAAQMAHTGRNTPTTTKRKGATPEAKVLKACIAYLEELDFYVLRTSAGFTQFDGRKMAIGRAGGHDLTCCAPGGKYVSIEAKSATGMPSEAQLRQRQFIERRGGIVIVPHSVAELRQGLVAAFGEQAVKDWETLGAARKRR